MNLKKLTKELKDLFEVYIEGSNIKEMVFIPTKKRFKIILKFDDDSKLEFNSITAMQQWLHSDQFGE